MDITKQSDRRRSAHKIACYTFIASVLLLLGVNLLVRMLVFRDSIETLCRNFALPFFVVAIIYVIEWNLGWSTKLMVYGFSRYKISAFSAPIAAILLSYLWGESQQGVAITLFSLISMCVAIYALQNFEQASMAIIIEAIVFIWIAAQTFNTAAMVSILLIAEMLLVCMPKLSWYIVYKRDIHMLVTISTCTLIFSFYALLFLDNSGVLNAFGVSAYNAYDNDWFRFLNAKCAAVIQGAKLMGSCVDGRPSLTLYGDRVWTIILAQCGWIGAIPCLAATILMITSGIYLSRKRFAIQHYLAVGSLALIAVQSVGFFLTCCGWDYLRFPEISPFLSGGIIENTIFLLMAVLILPPKQKRLDIDVRSLFKGVSDADDLELDESD